MKKSLFDALKSVDEVRGTIPITPKTKKVNVTVFTEPGKSVAVMKSNASGAVKKRGEKYSSLKAIIDKKKEEMKKSDFSVIVMIADEKDGYYHYTKWVEASPLVTVDETGKADFGEPIDICLNRSEYQAASISKIALISNSTGVLYVLMPESFNSCGRLLSCAGAFRFGKEGTPLAPAMMLSEAFISGDRRVNLCYENISGSLKVKKVTAVVGKRFSYMTNVQLIDLVSNEINARHLCHIDSWSVEGDNVDVRFEIDSYSLSDYQIYIDIHTDCAKSCVSSVLQFNDIDAPMTVRKMTFNRNAKSQRDNIIALREVIAAVDDVPADYERNKTLHIDSDTRGKILAGIRKCVGVKTFRKLSFEVPDEQSPNDFCKEIMERTFSVCSSWAKPEISGVYYKAFKGGK